MGATLLTTHLDQLLACFNRGSLDVPDGLLDRNTTFSLNGVAYESMLGRSADDPLVRLIARGPAGYRFAAQALVHTLGGAQVTRSDFMVRAEHARGTMILTGALRGSGDHFEETVAVTLRLTWSGALAGVDVTMDETALARLRAARTGV